MVEPVAPRTLLEAVVRSRQLSWDEAADLVAETTRGHEKAVVSISGRHLGRLARGERAGARPNPATRRRCSAPSAGRSTICWLRMPPVTSPSWATWGLATFGRPQQLFYAADALFWLLAESVVADDYARQAVAAYSDPTQPEWAFGDAAVSRADLALVRIAHGEAEGAADAHAAEIGTAHLLRVPTGASASSSACRDDRQANVVWIRMRRPW